jgi:hypothetical protein
MKTKTIFKRKVNIGLLFTAVILISVAGCKKGTFDINNTNPNSPATVPPQYSLSAALAGTANLMYSANSPQGYTTNGNQDILDNWMGYWTQSGGYTASNAYVLYQLTSGTGNGNFDLAYLNLENYKLIITTAGTTPLQANFRAIAMIMTSFVYQRLVDLYNNVPYTAALGVNNTFSYKYDKGSDIYKACISKIDSAVAIIKSSSASATSPSNFDVMFGGDMSKWTKFANTLKLKMLMRQTQSANNGSLGDAGVKTALAGYTQADFLGAGEDAVINPGYSNAANNQLNPLYYDVVGNATGQPGLNQVYWRANSYAVNFYKNNGDPRDSAFYMPNTAGGYRGRAYGSTDGTEANSVISAIAGFGRDATGAYKGPSQDAPIIAAFESLFLQAEAIQRGYITGSASTTFNSAVAESFRILGVADAANAAAAYTAQPNPITNFSLASDPITIIITQKWAASNSLDPLESYSDWRRLGIPASLPVSIYPGNTAQHIPYRFPYPTSELSTNAANVPDGGTGIESLTTKIFWMP